MIPKILHRMWLDKTISNNNEAPKKYDEFLATFNKHNPEFVVMFWNMDKCKELFKNSAVSKYKSIWENLPHHIQKCDMARYIILYLHGGIYIDLDFTCFRNLSPLLNRDLLLVKEPKEYSSGTTIHNGFIGSVPHHPFWLEWLNFICDTIKNNGRNDMFSEVMQTTGPSNFGVFFYQSKYKNTEVVDMCDILPIYPTENGYAISEECHHRTRIYSDTYHEKMNNYMHTKWNEGSKWQENKTDNIVKPVLVERNERSNRRRNIYLIVIIIFVIVIIILAIYIYDPKNNTSHVA